MPAFVPAEESLGCYLTVDTQACSFTHTLLYRLSAGGNKTKKSIIKIIIESPLVWGVQIFFHSCIWQRWRNLQELSRSVIVNK